MTRKQELRAVTKQMLKGRAIQNARDWNKQHPKRTIDPDMPKELFSLVGKLTADELSALFMLLAESLPEELQEKLHKEN